ncbi:hypothetical protein AUJ63_01085 [Candidatus Pacearchaeota archaeon CG1_02_35_32]|nr:MAG: hypothetical protein AUJ63_01085 [Candidatus Pacearchaeota archaeon CG1_02_35_32]
MSIESIIWYLFLIDSIVAAITILFFSKWYKKNLGKGFVKHFSASKGWAILYLLLILWVGSALYRLGILGF